TCDSLHRTFVTNKLDSRFSIYVSWITLFLQPSPEPPQWIIKFIHHAFFQRDDPVIGDLNTFRAYFRTALGDVAIADALCVSQFLDPMLGVERVHLECSDMNQKTRPDKFFVHPVIAQNVTD